jgi:prophage DNA circulation protein
MTIASSAAPAPTAAPDLAEQVDASATLAIAATDAELVEVYSVDGEPSFALDSLAAELAAAASAVRDALEPLATATQEAARLAQETDLLAAQASSLVRTPANMVAALVDTLRTLSDTATAAPGRVLDALLDAYATVGTTISLAPETTATRQRERENQLALIAMIRRVLVVEAARLAPLVAYETLEEATEAATAIADLLEDEAGDADTTAYPALVTLRSHVRRAVPGDAVLARLVTVERPVAVPSLLLSYQLYGSVEREAELVDRNRTSHPGFMSGELQALSDG